MTMTIFISENSFRRPRTCRHRLLRTPWQHKTGKEVIIGLPTCPCVDWLVSGEKSTRSLFLPCHSPYTMVSVCLFVVLFIYFYQKNTKENPRLNTQMPHSLCAFHMAICSSRGHNWSSPTTIKPSCSSGILSIYRRVLLSESASGIASLSFLLWQSRGRLSESTHVMCLWLSSLSWHSCELRHARCPGWSLSKFPQLPHPHKLAAYLSSGCQETRPQSLIFFLPRYFFPLLMLLFSNTSSQTWRCQVPRQRRAAPWPGVDNEGNGAVTFSFT